MQKIIVMAVDKQQYLSDKLTQMAESATIKMAQQAREMKAQGHDVISLSLGEPDFDTPEHIKKAAKQALDDGYTKYTPVPGLLELREAICEKFKRDNNLDYSPSQIVVSNGAKQSIANLCLALLNPGDEVIVFSPFWVSYRDIVSFAGGVPVPVHGSIDADFKVTAEQLDAAITSKTKAILFSSPCNPTGSVYTHDELAALVTIIDKYDDLFIISDEIYEHINFTEAHASIGTFPEVKDQTITINGMSKGFSMTGWRIGYMGAPEWIAEACAKVQGQFTSGASAFGQKAAAVALQSDLKPTYEMKAAFLKRKQLVKDLLNDIPGVVSNDPKGAFYFFPDISSYFGKSDGPVTITDANSFAEVILHQAHVAVVSGSAFGDPNCFRLSYASSEENLIEALTRIKRTLSKFS